MVCSQITATLCWGGSRRTESRKQIFVSEEFDPETFVYKNANGVWLLHDTAQTQRIKQRIIEYFRSRNEDDDTLFYTLCLGGVVE